MVLKKLAFALITILLALLAGVSGYYVFVFQPGLVDVESNWKPNQGHKIVNFGSTKTLSILPLVNWKISNDNFKSEAGVSYLIKTDQQTLLFDVGFNAKGETPSPLQHNMKLLGVSLDSIDTIFLSHHHLDHSGGQSWVNKNTFSLGNEQVDLSGKKVFSPIQIEYPNVDVTASSTASIIGPGLASTGAISRQLFMGKIDEQALAINIEGKGLVLVVGCGHQTLPKILQRVAHVFEEPIYGIVGDLHYPVPEGRLKLLGMNLQRLFASGDGPLQPINQQTVNEEMMMLKQLKPSLVALGSHDTSDQVIEDFSHTFGEAYRYVQVGEWIHIAN